MDSSPQGVDTAPLSRLARPLQWALLLALSLALGTAFEFAHLPAALLIGPMLAAIVAGVNGAAVRVPKAIFIPAQAIIGCLIATSISPGIFPAFLAGWPLFMAAVLGTLAASSFLGWLISRWRILPGTTAVWGSAPGAASAMVLMAGAFGADQRLVAFMQYLRVMMVSIAAAGIARLWVDTSGVEAVAPIWFPPIDPVAFGATLAIAAVGGLAGWLVRLPSPFFLGAMILGIGLHLGLDVPMQLPEWLLAASYVAIGWSIGLNFNRPILRHAMRALPQVFAAVLALIAFCGGMAYLLWRYAGIDPLTAYLATSPGGMDSVAIIAAATNGVDVSFIMALQSIRFLIVLIFGPSLARLVARTLKE